MHQTKKGNQWYFGMKVHIGVEKDSGLIHSVETTSANVHDTPEQPSSSMERKRWSLEMPAIKGLRSGLRLQTRASLFVLP